MSFWRALLLSALLGGCGGNVAAPRADAAAADAPGADAGSVCPPGNVGDWPCSDACPCKPGLLCYHGQLMKPGCYVWPPDGG